MSKKEVLNLVDYFLNKIKEIFSSDEFLREIIWYLDVKGDAEFVFISTFSDCNSLCKIVETFYNIYENDYDVFTLTKGVNLIIYPRYGLFLDFYDAHTMKSFLNRRGTALKVQKKSFDNFVSMLEKGDYIKSDNIYGRLCILKHVLSTRTHLVD